MPIPTEQDIDERWRKSLTAGFTPRSPEFLTLASYFVGDAIAVWLVLMTAYRHPGARFELLFLLLFLAFLWVFSGHLMLKLRRYTCAELEKHANPALLHASHIAFRFYQIFLVASYITLFVAAAFVPYIC